MDFKKQHREHPSIHIDRSAVDKLKWSTHTDSVVKDSNSVC